MAGVNVANSNLTYINYERGFVETLNDEARSYNMTRKKKWTGKHIEGRIHKAWSTALGFTEDGGAFSTEDKQDYVAYKVGRRFFQAKIGLTNGVVATAKGSPHVARDVVDSEVRGMMTGALKYFNGFFFGDGTGVCATINGLGSESGGKQIDVEVDDSRMLWVGGKYQWYDSTLATNRGTVTIESVEQALNSSGNALVNLTTADPSGASTTDVLVWDGSLNRAFNGLDSLIDDDLTVTLQDVDLTDLTNSKWTSMVVDNGGTDRELTPLQLRQLLAGMRQKMGGKKAPKGLKVISDSWQGIEFEEMYEGELRLTPAAKVQGYASTSFQSALGRIDLEIDTDCTKGRVYACDPNQLVRYVQRELGWVREGRGIFKQSHTNAKQTAVMLCISQLAIEDRRSSGRIEDLSDEATIAY